MWRLIAAVLLAQPAFAESLVATRTIRAHTVIGPDDVTLVTAVVPGAISDLSEALGRETRVAVYAGRPLRYADIGAPALVSRNEVVTLIYVSGGLAISTEGRAMGRGAEGEMIRVINLSSRTTVSGRVGADGAIYVGAEQ